MKMLLRIPIHAAATKNGMGFLKIALERTGP